MKKTQNISPRHWSRIAVVAVLTFCFAAPVIAYADESEPPKNKVIFLTDSEEVATARYDLIRRENESIFSTYYLWDGDRIGGAALSAYMEAAQRGAKVRIIIDGLSALQLDSAPDFVKKLLEPVAPSASVSNALMKALLEEGVEVRIFNPIRVTEPLSVLPPLANTRTHEKFSYFKALNSATVGDRNWQAYNFRVSKKYPGQSYRSVEVVMEGDVTAEISKHAEDLWNDEKLVKKPNLSRVKPNELMAAKDLLRRYGKLVAEKFGPRKLLANRISNQLNPVSNIRFVHDIAGKKRTAPGMDHDLASLIENARTSIDFVSPYIVLTKRYKQMIETAIKVRHVKVRILTPALEVTDAPVSAAAFELQTKDLIEMGVEIYHHLGPDFLHAKMILVDGEVAGVLTHNFDFLSEYLNYESGVIVKDPAFAKEVGDFIQYLMDHEGRPYMKQPLNRSLYCYGWLMKFVAENPIFKKLKY